MTILNTIVVKGVEGFILFGTLLTCVGLLFAFVSAYCGSDAIYIWMTVLFIGIGVLIAGCVLPSDKVQYEVTLDDNVKMTEFYEEWNVVEQRGDIWVIEEKD